MIAALFVIYSVIYAFIYKQTISFSVIKTMVFNIIPELLNTYLTTSLYVICYFMWSLFGISVKFFIALGVLLIWLIIKDLLIKKFEVTSVKYKSFYDLKISSFLAALCIFTSFTIAGQFYGADLDSMLENKFVNIIFNIRTFPFYNLISSNDHVFEQLNLADDIFMKELMKIFIFALSVSVVTSLFKKIKTELSLKGIVLWTLIVTLENFLIISLYSICMYITGDNIGKLTALIVGYIVLSILINIIAGLTNTTSNISFGLMSTVLEGMFISFITALFIYVVDQLDENLLYFSTSVNEDVLIKELFISGIVISVLLIGWYIADLLRTKK